MRFPSARLAALVAGCWLSLPLAAFAQAVRGTVAVAVTAEPVVGAMVELISVTGRTLPPVTSDAAGNFYIEASSAGRYTLQVSRAGYRPQITRIDLRVGQVLEIRVNVAPEHVPPGGRRQGVQGRILALDDGAPVSDVRVSIVESGQATRSDTDGRFAITNTPAESLTVILQRIGLAADTVAVGPDDAFVTIYMRPRPVMLSAVESTPLFVARERFQNLAQTSTISITPADVEGTPTLGEPDVVRTVQLLAGTVSKNDYYVGFNVRGGEVDQNLIRLDGITVFNPTHVGGLFSTFDEGAVESIDLITGGFPARYGGRMSSVLDVRLRPGDATQMRLRGHVSLLSGKIQVEGPVGATGMTYLASVRRSYADALGLAYKSVFGGKGLPYYFADALARLTAPLPTGGTVALTGYWGRDQLDWPFITDEPGRTGVDVKLGWGNRIAGVTVVHAVGAVELTQYASISSFSTRLAMTPGIQSLDADARVIAGGFSATMHLGSQSHITIGGDLEDYRMNQSRRRDVLETVDYELAYRPGIQSGYLDTQVELFDRVQLRPGIRVDRVTGGAERTVVSPRVAMKTLVTENLALTGSAGRFYQALHSIRDQDVPLTFFEFWVGADDQVPVSYADHLVLGIEHWFRDDLSLVVEAYDKQYRDLVFRSFRDDPKVRGDEFFLTDGYARGVDVSLRRYAGKINGWLSYGYGKALRTTDTLTFAPSHDRRHTLNVVVQAPGPFRSQMGVRFGYGSPLPYTGITGQWLHRNYNSELHGFDYSWRESVSVEINGNRYPAYTRLDLGFRWRAEALGGVLHPYLQIINLFNRQNVWVYAFDFDRSPATRSGISQLPFFPTVGVEFEF